MSFMFLPDFIKHAVASAPATGNAVLGSAIPGFQSLANSPNAPASGSVVPYMFSDSSSKWERGYGTLTLSGSTWTLARTQVIESSAGVGTAENLSSAAQFWISIFSEDILNRMNKSVLRNPAIDIAQRGASGTVAAGTTAYTADGWIITATGAAVNWSVVYNQNIAGNALRISCASGLTGVKVSHRVESTIASRLLTAYKQVQPCCKQFILSNQTAAAIAPKFSGGYASARDNFSTVTPDVAATAMQSIPSAGTGQCALIFVPNVALTNGYQSDVDFAGALNAASGYVDFSLADLRVSPGISTGLTSVTPPAEVRDADEELVLCQRYFQVLGGGMCGDSTSPTSAEVGEKCAPQMRVSPSIMGIPGASAAFRAAGGDYILAVSSMTVAAVTTTPYGIWILIEGFLGLPAPTTLVSRQIGGTFLYASAEL